MGRGHWKCIMVEFRSTTTHPSGVRLAHAAPANGLISSSPQSSKSLTLRVATAKPRVLAITQRNSIESLCSRFGNASSAPPYAGLNARIAKSPIRSGVATACLMMRRTSSSIDTPCRAALTRSGATVSSSIFRTLKLATACPPGLNLTNKEYDNTCRHNRHDICIRPVVDRVRDPLFTDIQNDLALL